MMRSIEEGDANLERMGHRGVVEIVEERVHQREPTVQVHARCKRLIVQIFGVRVRVRR